MLCPSLPNFMASDVARFKLTMAEVFSHRDWQVLQVSRVDYQRISGSRYPREEREESHGSSEMRDQNNRGKKQDEKSLRMN